MTSRHYCFTSFDDDAPTKGDKVRYLVYQYEKAPETGRMHWQGYAEFTTPLRISAAKRELGIDKCHLETRRGSREQAREYCMVKVYKGKDKGVEAGPYEEGEWDGGGQGKRNDVAIVAKMVKAGATERKIADAFPVTYMRMYRGIRELKNVTQVRRTWKTEVEVYYGPSRNETVWEMYPDAYAWSGGKWWDGYDGDETVIMTDWEACSDMSPNDILRLSGSHPHMVNTKFGMKNFLAKKLIITVDSATPSTYFGEKWDEFRKVCKTFEHCE